MRLDAVQSITSTHSGKRISESATDRTRIWRVAVVAGIVLAVVLAKYLARPDATEIRAADPKYQDVEASISTVGEVIPVGEFQARANFAGTVERVLVKLGQNVTVGQMLIQMKDPFASSRVAAATAALKSAEVNNDNVQRNGSQEDRIGFAADRVRAQVEQDAAAKALSTLKQLQKNGSAAEGEVAAAERRVQAANATMEALNERSTRRYSPKDIASWNARVAEAQASLDAEKLNFDNSNIKSPIAGTVYLLPVSQYDFVPMGAELLLVADLSKLQVRAKFDEPDVGKLVIGQPVKITWDGKPGRIWHGHITHAPLAVESSGLRSFGECTIGIDDARGDLPANTNVNVTVRTKKKVHVLTIPREALHTEGTANFVFRVVGDKLVRTPVQVGLINLNIAEITRGLTRRDLIALHALNNQELTGNLAVKAVQ